MSDPGQAILVWAAFAIMGLLAVIVWSDSRH